MHLLHNPNWINQHQYPYQSLAEVPQSVFDAINTRLVARQTTEPVVSIIVAAYNEEVNLIRCISTLSAIDTAVAYEIIVVNNNSADRTQETIDRLRVRGFYQPIQGCGPARQLGQEQALGTYVLLADADCFYPATWLDTMLQKLRQPGVVCVYGSYSFMSVPGIPRWQLAIHEALRDVIRKMRHLKRPYLNAYGISLGYVRKAGLTVGFIMHNTWGDDGRLCFDLMQHGRVVAMNTTSARVWTGPRTLLRDGNMKQALWIRLSREVRSLRHYLTPEKPHDTKTSKN